MHIDIDKISAIFHRLDEETGSNPDTRRMREAAIALHFVWGNGHLHNFEDLLFCFKQSAAPAQEASVDTREQALAWLEQERDARQPICVAIAGTRYSRSYSLERGDIGLIRVPTRHELTSDLQDPRALTDEIAAALHRVMPRITALEDMDSILTALLALYFIVATGQSTDFESFLHDSDPRVALGPLRVFDTRQEADGWLKSHPRPPHGARVELSGQRFSVGYDRESDLRVLVRSPTLEELGLTGQPDEQDS